MREKEDKLLMMNSEYLCTHSETYAENISHVFKSHSLMVKEDFPPQWQGQLVQGALLGKMLHYNYLLGGG